MKVTIRVEITTDWDETETYEICQLERPYRQLEPDKVGLSLAEGKDVLHRLQQAVVAAQAEEVCMLRRFCTRCHRFLELKDRRIRKVDTVFGTVPFRSARFVCCPCDTPLQLEYPYSPMTEFVPERATAEAFGSRGSLQSESGALRSRGVEPNSAVSGKVGTVQLALTRTFGRQIKPKICLFHPHIVAAAVVLGKRCGSYLCRPSLEFRSE